MTTAVKVWCPAIENEPDRLFNQETCPEAPPHWFEEEPKDAAELYGLELFMMDRQRTVWTIHVLDNAGMTHLFRVTVNREIGASVEPLSLGG